MYECTSDMKGVVLRWHSDEDLNGLREYLGEEVTEWFEKASIELFQKVGGAIGVETTENEPRRGINAVVRPVAVSITLPERAELRRRSCLDLIIFEVNATLWFRVPKRSAVRYIFKCKESWEILLSKESFIMPLHLAWNDRERSSDKVYKDD